MGPDETDNALSDWERIGQVLRGIGWALLTILALFAWCALFLGMAWLLVYYGCEGGFMKFVALIREMFFYWGGVIERERTNHGF